MKKLIILIVALIFSNCYANTEDCKDLAINLQNCSKYQCYYFANAKDYIEYKILGKNDNNLCRYTEQYNNNVMTCNYSSNGVKAQLNNIFNRNIDPLDTHELENIQAKECVFSSQENIQTDNILEKFSKNKKELESVFFNQELIYRLSNAIGQFDKKHIKSTDTIFVSDKIRLNSILYLSPNIWKIWVNGELFQNNKNLIVSYITPEYVTFTWTAEEQFQNKNITFTLYPNQTFDAGSIFIGK